ncbi:fimbrial protein [Brenneria roseae subsp. americana]|uniref:Fimbrial protein n=1 Tax=Brenneria roseae subsp. americana TaxID=1508507 RepID=A0A2U1TQN5_9GAMM|nr:PilN domain-containing protein [Brenneria roseae]PWC11682.1 fimbrial protein [Brenneria roseae subsp. americana]
MLLVNFLPWRQRRLWRRARNWLMALLLQLLLAAVLFGIVYSLWHRQYTLLLRELGDVSAQRQQWVAQYQQTRQIWEKLQQHQAQHEVDAAGNRHNQRYLSLLEQLSLMMPERLWLTEIADRGTHLSIAGMSENYTDIVNLNRALGRHPSMGRVRILNALRQQNGRSLLHFALQADWQTEEPAGSGVAHD